MGRRADEKNPESVPVTDASAGSLLTVRRVVVFGSVCVILAGILFVVLQLARLGDPADPEGLSIDNRTDQELLVYGVLRRGGTNSEVTDEELRAKVPPGTIAMTRVGCGSGEFVARTDDGDEVARRVSTECSEDPWIIEDSP